MALSNVSCTDGSWCPSVSDDTGGGDMACSNESLVSFVGLRSVEAKAVGPAVKAAIRDNRDT